METTIDEHIGRRIREARLLMGRERGERLTQTELGAAIGVSFQQIQKYENGSNKVSGSRLWKLADCFGVPVTFSMKDWTYGKANMRPSRTRRS